MEEFLKALEPKTFPPFSKVSPLLKSEQFKSKGLEAIASGKAAALVVAGGLATRLKLKGSKGLFPISLIKNKTLFQLLAEKVLACSIRAERDLFLCIMTSKGNDEEIRAYFEKNNHFGLKKDYVLFFSQGTLPFMLMDGTLIDQEGPDGNGVALQKLNESGILQQLKKSGVEFVTFTMIDNPLVDPFDPYLIGCQIVHDLDAAILAVKKLPEEKAGTLVDTEDGIRVVEYSECQLDPSFDLANISAFSFKVSMIEKAANGNIPLHAHKKEVQLDQPTLVYKFEKFIFDNLMYAKKSAALLYPREEVFSPLKNFSGKDSPEEVRKALWIKDRTTYEQISGLKAPEKPFELGASFYYPTEDFLKRWRGKPLPDVEYIEGI